MHEKWIKEALKQALMAKDIGEVPVGAIIVSPKGDVLARAHNLKELKSDPMGHAEILAIKKATKTLSTWRLTGATLYVTLEPCMMCTGALIQSRIKEVVFGAYDPKGGCISTLINGLKLKGLNHKVLSCGGILEQDCGKLLTDFFKTTRR